MQRSNSPEILRQSFASASPDRTACVLELSVNVHFTVSLSLITYKGLFVPHSLNVVAGQHRIARATFSSTSSTSSHGKLRVHAITPCIQNSSHARILLLFVLGDHIANHTYVRASISSLPDSELTYFKMLMTRPMRTSRTAAILILLACSISISKQQNNTNNDDDYYHHHHSSEYVTFKAKELACLRASSYVLGVASSCC